MTLKISKPLSKILRAQKKFGRLVEASLHLKQKSRSTQRPRAAAPRAALMAVAEFGSNPGRLSMKLFVPPRVAANPALVVILHGCRQTPESLEDASGFSRLATERGFILLYPQQRDTNNTQRCFNWFRPSAVTRDRGEVMSIRQMIEHTCRNRGVDRSRVYIAGLSAGGALAAALLVSYPKLFAGVAIFAGMPYGAARDAVSAMRLMKSGSSRSPAEWGDFVRAVSPTQKIWPPISIWQGTGDRVVAPQNAEACVSQWLNVLKIEAATGRPQQKPWGTLTRWDGSSKTQISLYQLKHFGHGLPVSAARSNSSRAADPYVIDAGISGPKELMRIWGLKRLPV
ncbi:extracellular catalytic domain type 1 short-chain-length polyhydroxyalkanoate depolymerase [Ensifer adhaerens]|jgi:poly(hydroxyalkanoate) depolymerase family esterase|uniref:extracellular catalytic domain type 1 short-chain-length polyhydroxyalkanoate depolymerase n=1 Tax=Ensifer adhaerens TaxID=106592 RepID=UPI000961CC6B|nr:PHB depolymerase family esterase [Ensifer adhaerens]OKP69118.1 polyhydroxybutyrate depolymerase [Ensifer adhaerens]